MLNGTVFSLEEMSVIERHLRDSAKQTADSANGVSTTVSVSRFICKQETKLSLG